MTSETFDSYAQNGEDVVLWRALKGIAQGRYVDVGANHPSNDSVTMAFYARGWSGIAVEPDPEFAQLQREQRPGDILVEAAITAKDDETVTLHVVEGTGLSTLDDSYGAQHRESGRAMHDKEVRGRRLDAVLKEAGWSGEDIHFMSVDTEGSERAVLESIDLSLWRPWVLVIEATAPNSAESTRESWESLVTEAGYEFCLFDGLSCFYVAEERAEQLAASLSYPACVLDNYSTLAQRECWRQLDQTQKMVDSLAHEAIRWRAEALNRWAGALAKGPVATALRRQLEALRAEHAELGHQHHLTVQEITALHGSTSWRVTKPLRTVGSTVAKVRGGR
jgi:FkbM family methyltransferase